ncbi:hypothetical protein OH492_09100 [Vibrio chagasii]|nr:hypothetical protein [Vibrio chagasii]
MESDEPCLMRLLPSRSARSWVIYNLFGDTHSVVVNIDERARTALDTSTEGDTVQDMMRYVALVWT